jgi:hypothetical protein
MKYYLNKTTTAQAYQLDGSWDAIKLEEHFELSADRYMLIKSPTQHIELYFGVLQTWLSVDNDCYGFVEYETGLHILIAQQDIFILQ